MESEASAEAAAAAAAAEVHSWETHQYDWDDSAGAARPAQQHVVDDAKDYTVNDKGGLLFDTNDKPFLQRSASEHSLHATPTHAPTTSTLAVSSAAPPHAPSTVGAARAAMSPTAREGRIRTTRSTWYHGLARKEKLCRVRRDLRVGPRH